MTASPAPGSAPTLDELVARASALVPALRQRAPEAESLRRIPDATVEDIRASGLVRTMQPAHFGGYEQDYRAFGHVVRELARGCASTAWCAASWMSQAWAVSHHSARAQEDIFADGPDVFIATTGTPSAKAEPVEGGWMISGRWPFGSGVHATTWMSAGTTQPDGRSRYILIPTAELEITDVWYSAGLSATGSTDTIARDVFVPDHRTLDGAAYLLGPPSAPWVTGPMANHRLVLQATSSIFAPVAVGNAMAFLDAFAEAAARRTIPYARARQSEHIGTQQRFGESAIEADLAWMLLERIYDTLDETAATGVLSLPVRARIRRDTAFAGHLAYRAIDRVYHVSGAHALLTSSELQRRWRDAHAVISQPQFHWDFEAETWAKVALGLEHTHPLL